MSPIAMALVLVAGLAWFAFSARRRWRLLRIGAPESRCDRIGQRVRLMLRQAFGQQRMGRYPLAGFAHKAIFFGFLVLLLRSLILMARGFVADPGFGFRLLDDGTTLGDLYSLVKDVYVVLVVVGTGIFLYLRLVAKPARMTLKPEGVLILLIILVLMLADVVYDGAGRVHAAQGAPLAFNPWHPLGSLLAPALRPLPDAMVTALWRLGFWSHVVLVLLFLNILPYTKHFHVITAIPNVFLQDLSPPGRLAPIGDIEGRIERGQTLGVRRIDDLTWKGILDLYTCTECGRCTDQCPAARTGKILSPKQLTIDLRGFLYENDSALVADTGSDGHDDDRPHRRDLVPGVVNPEALWACTTCGACEQECPVSISYVDKIVDMRRHLVQERGEAPAPLQEAFSAIEAVGNPFGAPEDERMRWAEGLDVPIASTDGVDVLFWVGCAPAIDERARSIARAMARLLNLAGVKWACLGLEERCTGDPARRAGNEYLFEQMARANIQTLDRCNARTILTVCPHCYNTLKNEYPDFGGRYEVVHHADYLARLIADGRLKPAARVEARVVYHDSCYLGRGNGIYDSPRAVLGSIPGVQLVEPGATRDRGMCCGAGGAQMFKEEEPGAESVSVARTRQLLDARPGVVASACPFCKRMLSNGLESADRPDVGQQDIAEILLQSVAGGA